MTREILFRGKGIIGGKWREGHFVACKNNGRTFITELIEVDEDSWLYWEVDTNTVGQYTGFKDDNGKSIFEGDILQYKYAKGTETRTVVVCYGEYQDADDDDGHPGRYHLEWYIEYGNCKESLHDEIKCWNHESFKVIGNIYDNPELLCPN